MFRTIFGFLREAVTEVTIFESIFEVHRNFVDSDAKAGVGSFGVSIF
jgi:hypothetical protein